MSQVKEMIIHNLSTREVRPIHNWHEWLERWLKAVTLEEMIGLLHAGLTAPLEKIGYTEPEYNQSGRLSFYFSIADGWANEDSLRSSKDKDKEYDLGYDYSGCRILKTPSQLRQQVASKAFDMLCINFFKKVSLSKGHKESRSNWESLITSEKFFSMIQHFFRVEEHLFGGIRIRNLSSRHNGRTHNEEQAINFLLGLTDFIWDWKQELPTSWSRDVDADREKIREKRRRLNAAKPWTIEVLSDLSKLEWLETRISKFDKPCLVKLEEIALDSKLRKYEHPVSENRSVTTLDEARYLCSESAWLIEKHELYKREYKRLTAILKAEEERDEAELKIKELKP